MKKFFLLFALCAFAFAACEKTSVETPKGKLTLTSKSVMNFEAAGGAGEITYAFVEEETRANQVTAIAVVDWITDVTVGDNKVTFNVASNNGDERSATIKVEYGSDSFQVMISQAGGAVSANVNFTASYMGGTFYGKFIVDGGQTEGFNYFVILSDSQPESISSIPTYATEYRFDIYAGESSEFNREVHIPVGTYTIDHSRSSRIGTIDAYQDCSYVYNNGISSPFKSGTLTVTEDSIVADVVLMNGEVHHVEYNGAPIMEDYSLPTYADVYPVSQYTDTLSFDVTGGYMYAYYRGNWFGGDTDVWFMHMIENKVGFSGVYMIFNFIVPKSVGGFNNTEGYLGEYTLSDPTKSLEYTFPAGRLRDDSQQLNAWYMYSVNGQIDMSQAAPIVDGTIKVEKIDGDTVVITVDGKDDAGNDVKGTFRGNVRELENQGTVVK